MEARLQGDKQEKMLDLIRCMLGNEKVKVKEVQVLSVTSISHAVVRAGRSFCRRSFQGRLSPTTTYKLQWELKRIGGCGAYSCRTSTEFRWQDGKILSGTCKLSLMRPEAWVSACIGRVDGARSSGRQHGPTGGGASPF